MLNKDKENGNSRKVLDERDSKVKSVSKEKDKYYSSRNEESHHHHHHESHIHHHRSKDNIEVDPKFKTKLDIDDHYNMEQDFKELDRIIDNAVSNFKIEKKPQK